MREGTASGEIQGQKWQATLTAERDTDHTGLTQAVTAARQAYDEGAGEYTAASLENLADTIEQADELDRTGATDEAMDAMRDRLAEAVGNLDTITWKTDGTTLSHEKGQGYNGKAPDTGDTAPGDTIPLASNDPTLGKLGSITIPRIQNDDPATLTDEDLGVARATGTATTRGPRRTGTARPPGARTTRTRSANASRRPVPTARPSASPSAMDTCPPPSPQASTRRTNPRTPT